MVFLKVFSGKKFEFSKSDLKISNENFEFSAKTRDFSLLLITR